MRMMRPLPAILGFLLQHLHKGVQGVHVTGCGEPGAQARPFALRPYAASVGLHYPLADGEAQSRTRNAALTVVPVDPGELPEQLRQKIVGQARAVVADGEGDLHAVLRGSQSDDGRLRGMPLPRWTGDCR